MKAQGKSRCSHPPTSHPPFPPQTVGPLGKLGTRNCRLKVELRSADGPFQPSDMRSQGVALFHPLRKSCTQLIRPRRQLPQACTQLADVLPKRPERRLGGVDELREVVVPVRECLCSHLELSLRCAEVVGQCSEVGRHARYARLGGISVCNEGGKASGGRSLFLCLRLDSSEHFASL